VKLKLMSALAAGLLSAAPAFSLTTVTLDFQGAGDYTYVDNYYNGGTNADGASGVNYGISFGPGALAATNVDYFSYYSNAPTPTVLTAVGSNAALNSAAGFSGEISFWYSSVAATSVSVFSGLNGTGSLLATFALAANAQDGCSDTPFCNWQSTSLNIAGVGQSIQFGSTYLGTEIGGVAGFDNITVTQVPVPAAAWLLLSGLSGLGVFSRRKNVA
jgi:hypothetical protein